MVVVDASFAGAWILPDEYSHEAESVLANVLRGRQKIAVPELWAYEILNLIVSAWRRGRIEAHQVEEAVRLIEQIPIEFHDHQSRAIQDRAVRIASRFSLSAYDAAYLELADRFQCPLLSLDDDLTAAARSVGLD